MCSRLLMLLMLFALSMPISYGAESAGETTDTESTDEASQGGGSGGDSGSAEEEPDCE